MSRCMVCRCEDVDLHEVKEALAEGFDDLESLRRFTAIGTGPCQGKACIQETIRLLAAHHGVREEEVGQMTLRPPFSPVPLGFLAALPAEALERILEPGAGQEARALREALEGEGPPRTGRASPEDVARSMAEHRERRDPGQGDAGVSRRSRERGQDR